MEQRLINRLDLKSGLHYVTTKWLALLTLLLLPVVVSAQPPLEDSPYGLWIQGIAVTDDNKTNILNGESASVSFNAETGVLSLNNATIVGSTMSNGCILSSRSELTISISGYCTISPTDTCTAIRAISEDEQTLTIAKGGDNCILAFNVSRAIRDFVSVSYTDLYWDGNYTYSYHRDYQSYMLLNPYDEEVENAVLTDAEPYPLWIGEVQVTSANADNVLGGNGEVSYDQATNTLTLHNASIMPEQESPAIIYEGTDDLVIMLIGTNHVQGSSGCEGIRLNSQTAGLIFATEGDGKLISTGEEVLFESYISVEYRNGLGLSTFARGQIVGVFESYNLWVMGNRVTSMNKEDITGDGTVRFTPSTNTLSLYSAQLGSLKTDTIISSGLPNLTIDLHGNSIFRFIECGITSRITANAPSLTFTTNSSNPGQLSWIVDTNEADVPPFTMGFEVTCEEPLRSYETCEAEHLISAETLTTYDLAIGTTAVTSANCTDVLGNGNVKYIPEDKILVLDHSYLTEPIVSSLTDGLTIYLLGENIINADENLITSTVADAPLTIITSGTAPGSLTLKKNVDTGLWVSGFGTMTIPDDYATTTIANEMTINRAVGISPIIAETEDGSRPKTERSTEAFYWAIDNVPDEEMNTYISVGIDDVIYTLRPCDFNDGNYDDLNNDPSGVNLTEVPADMATILTLTPGSSSFTNLFRGLTIEVPAGNGEVTVRGEIGTGAILAVKIGSNEPVLFPNAEYPDFNTLETIRIPYSCSENTFVYIYLAQTTPSSARAESPFRGRVLGGHIKISNVGAAASSVVSTNSYSYQSNTLMTRVVAYDLPASATASNNRGIVLSTISMESQNAPSRGIRRVAEEKKITELGANIFDNLDKEKILYVDLSGTAIKDMTVNRNSGTFGGFKQNTLFYLPADNDDGGESNVILGDKCKQLSLTEAMDFCANRDFMADNAELDRSFSPGKTSTVFLPFALSVDQADALGTFHTFKEIQGSNAIFNPAETAGTLANTPYIILPKAAKIDVQNVSIEGLDDTSVQTGNMIGTYEKVEWATEQANIYGFAAKDLGDVVAGEFVRADEGAWVPPFRAYIQVNDAPARLNLLIGDNTATGVYSVGVQPSEDEHLWYNVNGQRLSGKPTMKGLFINNGKKITVK